MPSDLWCENEFGQYKKNELGLLGVSVWRNLCEACGLSYVPLRDKRRRCIGTNEYLPDADVSTGRHHVYMDAHCKKNRVLYRKANQLRHGMDRTDANDYAAVSEFNRQKAMLGVVELFEETETGMWSGRLLAQTIGALGAYVAGFGNQEHMAYWPANRFAVIATLTPSVMFSLKQEPVSIAGAKDALMRLLHKEEVIQGRLFA